MNGAGARDYRPGKFYGRPGRSIAKYLEIFRNIAHANTGKVPKVLGSYRAI